MDNKENNIINLDEKRKEKGLPETPLQKTLDIFEDISPDELAEFVEIKPLLAALQLPENEFALLSEVLLNEMEKQLNSVSDKLLMVQALNAAGLKAEDLADRFDILMEEIKKGLEGQISQQKIDFLQRFFGLLVQSVMDTEGVAKRIVPIPIETCHENAKIPAYAKAGDAGMDVYALEDIELKPGEKKLIPLGIKVALPLGYELQVRPRSGMALKTDLSVANSPGTIDSGYRDEIGVIIKNTEPFIKDMEVDYTEEGQPIIKSILFGQSYTITAGMRFAQIVLNEVASAAFYPVSSIGEIGFNRDSGFGGTGLF